MAELYPLPFPLLLKRALREFAKNRTIFDLPERAFYRPPADLDTRVHFCGHAAATPLGPAAGPHTQLAQNIVLSWLGGSRIMELKTVQILDRLKISRPCIDIRNIGYNVEWSQELRLEESLREYVAAHVLIEILTAANVLGVAPGPTIFDISVGYDLKGITCDKIRTWLNSLRDATTIVEELRQQIPEEFSEYRNLPFQSRISDSITLSTFHGCPANEIESIAEFLITEMDFHVTIKMNPPMLGKQRLESLLHDHLGYRDITVNPAAYETGISFEEGVEIVQRLQKIAHKYGRHLGVKFSNTLEVLNKDTFFSDKVMYLSGQPLHVLAMSLVSEWRQVFDIDCPISFSAGIDQHNFAEAVACGLVPITTCTDLLRPGGYGRLHKYLRNLQRRMQEAGATSIQQFTLMAFGHAGKALQQVIEKTDENWQQFSGDLPPDLREKVGAFLRMTQENWQTAIAQSQIPDEKDYRDSVQQFLDSLPKLTAENITREITNRLQPLYQQWMQTAALLNTENVLENVLADPRYRFEKNKFTPRKIGRHLALFDCINCDKCIPVCPNDANFSYEIEPMEQPYMILRVEENGVLEKPGGVFKIKASHQIANFADFCNDCGNCDVFCPEDGGPFVEKPRFFSNAKNWQKHHNLDGFFIGKRHDLLYTLARIHGRGFSMLFDPEQNRARFSDGIIEIECDTLTHRIIQKIVLESEQIGHELDTRFYLTTATVVKGVILTANVNYVNVEISFKGYNRKGKFDFYFLL